VGTSSPYLLSCAQCPFPTVLCPFRRSLPPEQPPVVLSVGPDAREVGLRTRRKPSRRHIQSASLTQHAQQHEFNKENLVRTVMCFPGCATGSPGPSLTPSTLPLPYETKDRRMHLGLGRAMEFRFFTVGLSMQRSWGSVSL